jgi:uncharacterized protein YndB with AHSA1/START domain
MKANALKVRLERVIAADRARVFEAWTDPDLMMKWYAPEGMSIPDVEVDLRVGGRWRVAMQEPEGGARHTVVGTYREITPPERLVTTWSWLPEDGAAQSMGPEETMVTVEFHEDGDTTRVVLVHEGFATADGRDNHEKGWESCLNRLERI